MDILIDSSRLSQEEPLGNPLSGLTHQRMSKGLAGIRTFACLCYPNQKSATVGEKSSAVLGRTRFGEVHHKEHPVESVADWDEDVVLREDVDLFGI